MTPHLLAAALAVAAPAHVQSDDGPRYVGVYNRGLSGERISFTLVYPNVATATAAAEWIAVCGFWRVDLATTDSSLVPPSQILEVFLYGLEETPPVPGGELPPPPDVDLIVECYRAWGSRSRP